MSCRAGGLTNEEGNLKGSFMIMDFDSRQQLDEYLKTEPYMTNNVWQQVTIETCNVVITGK